MMRILFLFSLFLLGCAPEKKAASFDPLDQDGKGGAALCGRGYSPLPLQREGVIPLPGPEALPQGRYTFQSAEYYVRQETPANAAPGFQAHFREEFQELGLSSRRICSAPGESGLVWEVPFPGVREFLAGPAPTHTPVSLFILGEGSNIRLSRPPSGDPVAGNLSAVLRRWSQVRIYLLSESALEIRMSAADIADGLSLTKRMQLRFQIAPLAP